jgi:hypothetical protein
MSAWSSAIDEYDPGLDHLISETGDGFAGIYHTQGQNGWFGETGFYGGDYRYAPKVDAGTTWDHLYVWAAPTFVGDTMYFSIQANLTYPPPTNRQYRLTLVTVPDGVQALAPAEGTVWSVSNSALFTLALPTVHTENGLQGYEFSFRITPVVPEPHVAGLLLMGAAGLGLRRRSKNQS